MILLKKNQNYWKNALLEIHLPFKEEALEEVFKRAQAREEEVAALEIRVDKTSRLLKLTWKMESFMVMQSSN